MALVLCTGVDPSVVHTRQLILERAGHVVVTALDEASLITACEQNKFEVAVVGQTVSAKIKRRIAHWSARVVPTPNCWSSITYLPGRSSTMRMHGWRSWQMCLRSLRRRWRRLPPDERNFSGRPLPAWNHTRRICLSILRQRHCVCCRLQSAFP